MPKQDTPVFRPKVPPDLDRARLIREEAFDWLDTHYPDVTSFTTGRVLRTAGEQGLHRRYGALALSDEWAPLRDRLHATFGEPPRAYRAT